MKRIVLLVVLLSAPVLARASYIVEVETFSAIVVRDFVMPGTPGMGGGLDFNAPGMIPTIDFTPGSVIFEGQPVDFDGKEPQFIASAYAGTARFPVSTGPANVTVPWDEVLSGAVNSAFAGNGSNVLLGPLFSDSNLDLTPGAAVPFSVLTPAWSSPAVPQLNGKRVEVRGTCMILNVNAINGVVNLECNGSIWAYGPAFPVSRGALIALALGLAACAWFWLSRSHRWIESGPAT